LPLGFSVQFSSARAVLAGIDLAGLAAGGVGVVRDAPVPDPAGGGLGFLVAQLECVVVLVDVVVVIEVQADPLAILRPNDDASSPGARCFVR
jgi:hypothetical protein